MKALKYFKQITLHRTFLFSTLEKWIFLNVIFRFTLRFLGILMKKCPARAGSGLVEQEATSTQQGKAGKGEEGRRSGQAPLVSRVELDAR